MASFMKELEHLEVKLEDIKSATDNFSENNVIGKGGFGKVYKGELSHYEGKSMVAIKRLDRIYGQGDPEFLKEITMLSCFKHKNLISLLGFCKEGDEMILIYELASRGSLDRSLKDTTLTWKQRLNICLDAAKGLSFLHDPQGTQQRVLHRDIKSANILLDENLNAKVADFGLSKISPANQKNTFLFTNPVGTHGYCDPLYMETYQLTKESDVYSFGVVLFEVLCGRLCFKNSDGKIKILVHYWKNCYEHKKLDEIIFPDLMQQMDPSSFKIYVDIAYQCLQKSHEQRPNMSVVVEKLEMALLLELDPKLLRELEHEEIRKAEEEMLKAAEYEYREILKVAEPPLIYKSVKELKALVSEGFPVAGGKTLVLVNDKGQVCERINIVGCLDIDHIDKGYLELLSDNYIKSRFPGGDCYTYQGYLNVRARAKFLTPLITYSVNLVFRNTNSMYYSDTFHYEIDRKTKCCMVYDTYERDDGWFVVPLYQFISDHKSAYFEINFQGFRNGWKLQVAGFEFQPLEEKMELHDQGFEEYQDIVEAASESLFYKSLEELQVLLSVGVYLNGYKTWLSLNENGEHCEMLSISNCLISREGGYDFNYSDLYSRFPSFLETHRKGFKVHIRTQFLTPSIRYTVNLVLRKDDTSEKQLYARLTYKLEGETETSIVHLANTTKDNRSFIAELYQFTSNGRTFDLDIVFEDHKHDLKVEGILFQPLDKIEHEQVLEDEELSNDSLKWTINGGVFSYLLKGFIGQEGYAVDNNGMRSVMFSARSTLSRAIGDRVVSFKSSPESRFGEVALVASIYKYEKDCLFTIKKDFNSDVISPETTYASYLIYKLPQNQSNFDGLLKICNFKESDHEYRYIYLVSPPETPIIGQKLDQNTRNPLNRAILNAFPRQRSDGWMEVKLSHFQTPSSTQTIDVYIRLWTSDSGLIIESIELRPIVGHSV